MSARVIRCWALVLGLLAACGERGLETKGALDRVVGETVTLALVKGGSSFDGELTLRSADGSSLPTSALQVAKKDDRTLTFVIPPGVPAGQSLAVAGRGGGGNYQVPLRVNRLALTLDDKGNLEAWALAPGSLPPSSFPTGASGGGLMSMAPGGGELALVAGDQVRLLALGREIKDVGAGVKQTGVVAVAAAFGKRVLAATDQSLILFRFTSGQQTTQETIPFKDARAVAASTTGDVGLVLFGCDTNSDGKPDAACVEQLSLGPTFAEIATTRTQLEAGPASRVFAATRDGKGAIVSDNGGLFGVYFGGTKPQVSKIEWRLDGSSFIGQPVGGDRAAAIVSGQSVDLFAFAEQSKKLLDLAAFNPVVNYDLQRIGTITLTDTPTRMSFGRNTQLFVSFAKSLVTTDVGQASPQVSPVVEVVPVNPIQNLAVQP